MPRSVNMVLSGLQSAWRGDRKGEIMGTKAALDSSDARLIREVYQANAMFGIPYLPDEKQWKQACKLAECGLLFQEAQVFPGGAAYRVTPAGVDAYNETVADAGANGGEGETQSNSNQTTATTPDPNATLDELARVVKQHGEIPPAAFGVDILDPKTGDVTESLTLSERALDKRIETWDAESGGVDNVRCDYGREDRDMFCRCEDTGVLLIGSDEFTVDTAWYALSGFAWRRECIFAMGPDDWAEARVFVEGIESCLNIGVDDLEEAVTLSGLKARIVESCFLPNTVENDTGFWNPGAEFQSEMKDLFHLFDFMQKTPSSRQKRP